MDDNSFAWNHGYSCAASSDINLSKNPFATGLDHLDWNFGFAFFQTEKSKAKAKADFKQKCPWVAYRNEYLARAKKYQDSADKIAVDAIKNGLEMVAAGKIVNDLYRVYGSYSIANLVFQIRSKFVEGIFKDGNEDACVRVLCCGLEMIKHRWGFAEDLEIAIKTESLKLRAFIRGENMRTAESAVEKARASLCTAIDECSKALSKYHEKL